jgi:hypothetical protein
MFDLFKRKKIKFQNPEELIATMEKISSLLNENGFHYQAMAFSKPIEYLKIDDFENFIKNFNTVDIWGGAGAAWEVSFASWEIEREFIVTFRKLIELMKNSGIKNRKAISIGAYFLKTLERND